jgi:hypothetical protein
MPIPTSYTYSTFENYLRDEVLMQTAESLGWVDVSSPAVNPLPVTVSGTIASSFSYIILTAPLSYRLPKGTVLQSDHMSYQFTLLDDAPTGSPTLYVNQNVSGSNRNINSQTVNVYLRDAPFDASTVYDSITDETLLQYGVLTIAEATDVMKLRAIGRIEAWRAVAQETASDTYFLAENASYSRNQVHEFALSQLEIAQSEYTVNFSVKPEVQPFIINNRSTSTKVKVVW